MSIAWRQPGGEPVATEKHKPALDGIGVLLKYTTCAVVAGLVMFACALNPDSGFSCSVACWMLALLFWISLWSWRALTNGLLDPYALFLMAAILFNGGQAILEVFHLNEYGILEGMFSPELTLKTLFLVFMGIASLHFGALVSVASARRDLRGISATRRGGSNLIRETRMVGWILLAISIVPAIMTTRDEIATVLSGGYFALAQREVVRGLDTAPTILALFLLPGVLFLLAGSSGYLPGIVAATAIMIPYSAIHFFLGGRFDAALPLLAFAWLWHRCIRPIPKSALIGAGVFLLVVVFPLVGSIRNISGESRLSPEFIVRSFFSVKNPIAAGVSEMGWSMRTIAHTLELVPRFRDFEWGVGYLYAIRFVTPNSFWSAQPDFPSHADWLMWTVDPVSASMGAGLGYSFIAEAYVNFGWLGVPFVLSFIGFCFGRFSIWGDRLDDRPRIAALGTFLAFFLVFARSESLNVIRPLIWYCMLPFSMVRGLASLRKPAPQTLNHDAGSRRME